MSEIKETVFLMRKHLNDWQMAYIKWACLCFAAVCTYLHSELKGYAQLDDVTGIQWLEMFIWSLGLIGTTTVAFLDRSAPKSDETKPTVTTSAANQFPPV